MLAHEVEKAFDEGAIVFVPSKKGETGKLKMILLDKACSEGLTGSDFDRTFGATDGQPLEFANDKLPSLHSLYIHALMAVLRRKRYNCLGWEEDIDKVFTGRILSSASEDKLRRGTVLALALEVGDILPSRLDDFAKKAIDESGAIDPAQSQITDQDRDAAVTVAGTWTSQEELQTWLDLSNDLSDLGLG